MKQIRQRFKDNYLLGCILYNKNYSLYLMPIAWWILNYEMYDPSYNPSDRQHVFRNNIINVKDDNVKQFLKSIEDDQVNLDDFKSNLKNIPKEYASFYFFVDFDEKHFVSSFPDIEVEAYLPNVSWKGEFGNPLNYLPDELAELVDILKQ